MSRARLAVACLVAFVGVLAVANYASGLWRIQGREPPEYGTWTGVLEVERKVRLLREFAREGPVDVLILSSSMGDHGISAEVLSREISAGLGRPFRVFNFGMGGADLTTYPLLYRFARLVAKPKEIWIASPVSTSPIQGRDSLDDKLLAGPLGRSLKFPPLLPISYAVNELPLVRNAAAMRDWSVNLWFAHRPVSNLDLYEMNRYGDTRSWLYNVKEYERGRTHIERHRDHVMKFMRQPNAVEEKKHHDLYFSTRVLGAVNDLRDLAARDGASLAVVAFDSAVSLTLRDREFLEASRRFYEPLAEYYGARLIDVRPAFEARPYMNSDPIHLNTIGAEAFSKVLASAITGKPAPPQPELAVSELISKEAPDPTWKTFTALVVKHRDEPSASLRLRYSQNWGLKHMRPFSNYRLAVRLPNGSESVLPVRVMEGGLVIADTSGLALDPVDQIVTAQLVARGEKMGAGMDLPLESYEWSAQRMPSGFFEEGLATVESDATDYSPVDSIKVKWQRLRDPKRHDWIGLFPVGGGGPTRISFDFLGGKEEGTLVLPPVAKPGQYELRLFRDNGWESIWTSKPITVSAPTGSVAVADPAVTAGHSVRVTWSGLSHPHKQDWVGLFPKGAKDDARLDFRYTGGTREGSLQIPVGASTAPGEYETRLFSAGGWPRLGTSATFAVVAPQGQPAAAKAQ